MPAQDSLRRDERLSSAVQTESVALDASESDDADASDATSEIEASARSVLEAYAEQCDCLLAQAGWLDLQGRVWGCAVVGPGWVDVVVVGGESPTVEVMRLDAKELEKSHGVWDVGEGRED